MVMESEVKKQKKGNYSLILECYSEPLTNEQSDFYGRSEREYAEFCKRLKTFISRTETTILEQGEHVSLLEYVGSEPANNLAAPTLGRQPPPQPVPPLPPTPSASSMLSVVQQQQPKPPQPAGQIVVATQPQTLTAQNSQIIVQNTAPPCNNAFQLVMDNRGVIVGAVSGASTVPPPTTVTNNTMLTAVATAPPVNTSAMTVAAPRHTSKRPPGIRPRVYGSQSAVRKLTSDPASKKRPQESTSIGGLLAGVKNRSKQPSAIVDLTDDETNLSASDNKEVPINKMSGKTYPSLVVVARPHLAIKDYPPSVINSERVALDSKVKKVLMVSASSFTEWLLQQGLVRCEQFCLSHSGPDGLPVKLKLGMYSDASKFPYSGGYVWISECCPHQFVSVFSGSIFEGAPHPPNVLLKLLYHWSCHTSIQNVVQWVKVDNAYVKNLFTNLRAVCTAALHNKYQKMGGNKKKIQVGVISLGTTSQDGNCRQVKVEVLGVLDPETKNLRIRAIEPIQEGERNYKKRFMKILEPLQHWVEKDSVILTDFTVDKGTLNTMGYSTVYQVATSDPTSPNARFSNQNIMEYLRKIVPRMFQNTLSLLTRQIIQQFLDELVWRERWGPIPSKAFSSIVEHIAEQTKLDTGGTLLNRLAKIASNPFKNWKYDRWLANCKVTNTQNYQRVVNSSNDVVIQPDINPLPLVQPPTFDVIAPITQGEMTQNNGGAESKGPLSKGLSHKGGYLKAQLGKCNIVTTTASELSMNHEPCPPLIPEIQGDSILIPLEPYFYATLPGNSDFMKNSQFPYEIKCVICHTPFSNNIKLMDHLIKHALNKSQHDHKELCKFCYKVTNSPGALRIHLNQAHYEGHITPLTCLICSVKLRDKSTFISHMTRVHYEMEMPYKCHVCNFRTSVHDKMVKHFYEVHDGGYSGVCPYCFKVVDFYRDKELLQNQIFFIIHIQKHQLSPLTKKCSRCALWFINKSVHEEHEASAHNSCRYLPGAERYEASEYLMMPPPPHDPIPSRVDRSKTLQSSINFKVSSFKPLKLFGISSKTKCCECEAEINDDHYLGHLSCTKCNYQTCCQRAMTEHNSSAHFTYTPRFVLGTPVMLKEPIYCACSFSTNNGHFMAEHLVSCGLTTCYLNKETAERQKANSASFPPLVNLEENEEMQWLSAYANKSTKQTVISEGPKSLLNLLGLVRKSSTDDASQDVMESENSTGTPDAAVVVALKDQKDEKCSKMAVDPEVIEIMDYEETDDNNKMAVDASPSPEAMVLD